MSREKQIEEMAEAICGLNTKDGCFCDGGYCNHNCLAYEKAKNLYNAGYRKQIEIVTEIIGIINKRLEINQYHLQGNNTDLFHGIYQGRYEAYRDIAEIIEQRYGAKMKGGAE